jgi:hypothetical protein
MMTKFECSLIEQAKLLSSYCEGRCRHVSFLVLRRKVVAIGLNSYNRTHPLAAKFGHLGANVHSELAAIVRFPERNRQFKKVALYNVRVALDGSIRLSAPARIARRC